MPNQFIPILIQYRKLVLKDIPDEKPGRNYRYPRPELPRVPKVDVTKAITDSGTFISTLE